MPKLSYSKLIFASSNHGKFEEYRRLMNLPDLQMAEYDVPDLQDMNAETLVRDKIKFIVPKLAQPKPPFFVEHSGLIIDAWGGLPGGLTAQFMKTVGNPGICKMMTAYQNHERIARVKTVIGYWYDGTVQTFEGSVTGTIAPEPRGSYGFIFDPIFIPKGGTQTFAEMNPEQKNEISMRGVAVREFLAYLDDFFVRPEAAEQVFISYSSTDWEDFVSPLVKHLGSASFNVWVDKARLKSGDYWRQEIDAALAASSYMILCLSPAALQSEMVIKEFTYFFTHKREKTILPIVCLPFENDALPPALRDIQYQPYDLDNVIMRLREIQEVLR